MKRLTIVLTSLLVNSTPLLSQGTQAAGATKSTENPTGQQAPSNGTALRDSLHAVESFVRYSDGRPVEFVRVIVRDTGRRASPRQYQSRTDSTGHVVFDSIAPGTYDMQVFLGGSFKPHVERLTVSGQQIPDVLIPAERGWWRSPWLVTLVVLIAFLFTVFATRWHHIARSLTAILESEFAGLGMRLQTEVASQSDQVKALRASIDDQWKKVKARQDQPWYSSFWNGSGLGDVLWWSRGVENAAWATIHETERQLVAFLAPVERVRVHLVEVEAMLREGKGEPTKALAGAIKESLAATKAGDTTREEEQRALLAKSLQYLNTGRDKTFAALMEWQNKASWLMIAAAIIILFLTAAVGNAVLFLAGAAGGFLSRLQRALKADDIPLDYGASWTTLFLSPMFGALVGWFGIALIELLTQPDVNLLGSAFNGVSWESPTEPITLAVAFILGFSERFFDAIVGVVEKQVDRSEATAGKNNASQAATSSTEAAAASAPTEPPASAGGITIDLPDTAITPVQTVGGKIVLEKPATAATVINLKTNNADYSVDPPAVTIAAGAKEGAFDVVPKGKAAPAVVRVTGVSGATKVSDTINYT